MRTELPVCQFRGETNVNGRFPCSSPKMIVPTIGVPETTCLQCPFPDVGTTHPTTMGNGRSYLKFNRDAASMPCKHLGAKTGHVELCIVCGDKNERELQACAIHGECTQEKQLIYKRDNKVSTVPWCKTCKEYSPNAVQ